MEIIRTSAYAAALKRLKKLGASTGDIVAMEDAIARSPESGAVIRGTNGLRKVRFGYGGRGKSGGRTIYYVMLDDEAVYLLIAYAKVDKEDLTDVEKRLFRKLIEELTYD
nr:addiction module toxin RelE [uncultured Sphingorhabdus sp.]